MSGHNRVSRVSAKAIGYLYFFDMYYFIWKVLDFNKLTALLCHWGYVLERLCRAMTETAERAQYGGSPLFILVSGRTLPSHRGNKGRQREIAKNGQKDSFVFYTVQMPKQYLFMKSAVT